MKSVVLVGAADVLQSPTRLIFSTFTQKDRVSRDYPAFGRLLYVQVLFV